MITRVFGKVDGKEVIFDKGAGDVWSVPVPLDYDGEYIVEIIAENESGVQAFVTRQLFTVTAGKICIKPLFNIGYLFENVTKKYSFDFIEPIRKERNDKVYTWRRQTRKLFCSCRPK